MAQQVKRQTNDNRLELRSLELLPRSQIGGRTFDDVVHGQFEAVSDASKIERFLASSLLPLLIGSHLDVRHTRHDGEVIGYPVHHVHVRLEEREILYEDPVDRI
jgi:hypothetical protein